MAPYIYFSSTLYIPTYLLVISIAYSIAIVWAYLRAPKFELPQNITLDFCLMIMVGGFFGARLFHILYENFDYYVLFPWDVLKVWQGGFVFYGGLIGAVLFSVIYSRLAKQDFWAWADFFAPILAFGYAAGRVGCLLNGCCFGEVCDLPWAIEFTHPGTPAGLRHPTQLYASLWELLIVLPILLKVLPRFKFPKPGFIFLTWLSLHAIGRLTMEYFRDDFRGQEIFGYSISSSISMILLILSFTLIFLRQKKK